MTARNDHWAVLTDLERAFASHAWPWESPLIDAVANCRLELVQADSLKYTRDSNISSAIARLHAAFTRHKDQISVPDKMTVARILSRNSGFSDIKNMIRYSLPGGDQLVIAGSAVYDRIGWEIVPELHFRVNVLPTLTRITVEKKRWMDWRIKQSFTGNTGVAYQIEVLHKACAKLGAVAVVEGDVLQLYFDNDEHAVHAQLSM